MAKSLKLITALGTDKNLILELVDFFNGGKKYRYSEEGERIRSLFADRTLSELHLICTEGVTEIYDELTGDLALDYADLFVHPVFLTCDDIICDSDDAAMQEIVYNEIEKLSADDLIISSGGRKQLTHRLIEAGLLYGCMGYLSITVPREIHENSEVRKMTRDFHVLWTPARQFAEERRKRIIKDELGDNFRSLYLLPANIVKRLREDRIGTDPKRRKEELSWLRLLPKADLHCHLGGAFDPVLLKDMAMSLLDELGIDETARERIGKEFELRLGKPLTALTGDDLMQLRLEKNGEKIVHPLQNLDILFQRCPDDPSHILTAVLVASISPAQIEKISWYQPAGLKKKNLLSWYMACGDLGGSALLQTEHNLRRALLWLMEEAGKKTCISWRCASLRTTIPGPDSPSSR